MKTLNTKKYLCLVLFIITFWNVNAQEEVRNEYRFTLVPTYSISKKWILTTYLGYVNNVATKTTSYYIGAPCLAIYKPNQVFEGMAGAFLVINKVKGGVDSKEFRPLAGIKLSLPNSHKLNIFNWSRYEYRSFIYDDESLNKVQNRIRNRIAIEFPISKKAWQPKTWYGFSDFEMFYTFEKGYFDRFRQRFGTGYIFNTHWRAEFIYHIQLLKNSENTNPVWTDNIFRLNVKWAIPHHIHSHAVFGQDVDD